MQEWREEAGDSLGLDVGQGMPLSCVAAWAVGKEESRLSLCPLCVTWMERISETFLGLELPSGRL